MPKVTFSVLQASNAFDKQHPEMKASLEDLIRMYPEVPLDCLQNIIVLASGSIAAASKVLWHSALVNTVQLLLHSSTKLVLALCTPLLAFILQ